MCSFPEQYMILYYQEIGVRCKRFKSTTTTTTTSSSSSSSSSSLFAWQQQDTDADSEKKSCKQGPQRS